MNRRGTITSSRCKKREVTGIGLLIVIMNIIHLLSIIMQSLYKVGKRLRLVTYVKDLRRYLIKVWEYLFVPEILPVITHTGRCLSSLGRK
jgi:hypothetical protein